MSYINLTDGLNALLNNVTTYKADSGAFELSVCNSYINNLINPLYVAIVCYVVRVWGLYYIDRIKYPKLFTITESVLDTITLFCIVVTIYWFHAGK